MLLKLNKKISCFLIKATNYAETKVVERQSTSFKLFAKRKFQQKLGFSLFPKTKHFWEP